MAEEKTPSLEWKIKKSKSIWFHLKVLVVIFVFVFGLNNFFIGHDLKVTGTKLFFAFLPAMFLVMLGMVFARDRSVKVFEDNIVTNAGAGGKRRIRAESGGRH